MGQYGQARPGFTKANGGMANGTMEFLDSGISNTHAHLRHAAQRIMGGTSDDGFDGHEQTGRQMDSETMS